MNSDPGHGHVSQGVSRGTDALSPGRVSRRSVRFMPLLAVVLAVVHVVAHLAWSHLTATEAEPGWLDGAGGAREIWNLNLALYVAHVFLLACILLTGRRLRARHLAAYAGGYAAIVWLLWPWIATMPQNLLMLVLAVVVYGSLLRHPRLLGYLYLFLFCQRFMPAYLYPSFALTALLYTTLGPFVRAWRHDRQRFVPMCHLMGLVLLTCLLIPVVFFCTQSPAQNINQRFHEPAVLEALLVSFKTSAIATVIVLLLGVPFAYAMVRTKFPARGLIDTLIDLPIVVPPPIVGILLLAFLGPKSPLGAYLESRFGLEFDDRLWPIVVAQLFVGSPYLIRASMVAFSAVDVRYENVARTLGASTTSAFFRLTLPMSMRGILIGVILTWFRAMAEFGSLQIMAHRPRTVPILTFERYLEYGQREAQPVGVLILLLCLCVIVGMWIIRSMPALLGKSIGASDAAR